MTQLWAKMVDTDGDGNLEAVQLHDEDPATLWHPDLLAPWQAVPPDTTIGSVLETSTGKWWSGADWLTRKLEQAEAADVTPPETKPFKGSVTKLKIKNAGANYEIPFVRNQYDIGNGKNLIVVTTYDSTTDSAASVEIIDGGYNYEVGQTFRIEEGYGRDWDRKNPSFTVIEIEEVYDAEDAVVHPLPPSQD